MSHRIAILFLSIFIFGVSCNKIETFTEKDTVVARVYNKELNLSEVSNLIPDNLSSSDSNQMAQTYINKWITEQLKLKKAELYLKSDEKVLDKKLADYRAALLIHSYEQVLIHQKLDTFVSDQEISAYYQDHLEEFILRRNIVKMVYVQLPENAPDYYRFRRWFRSYKEDDLEDITEYLDQFAIQMQDFDGLWVFYKDVADYLPNNISNEDRFISNNDFNEFLDSDHKHLIKINDHKLKGENSPLMLVKENIRDIILIKRKLNLIRTLEEESFNEALKQNNIEIYKL